MEELYYFHHNRMQVRRQGITKKQFEALNSERVEYQIRDPKLVGKMSVISGLVPKVIEPVYGKPDFSYKGEYIVKGWCFAIGTDYFFLFSAPKRGTTVESTTTKDKNKLQQFADSIIKDLGLEEQSARISKIWK